MKCTIPEISWHNRDPVLSVDIHPLLNEDIYRLASGGADCHLLIWHLKVLQTGSVNLDLVSDLTRHQKAINVVRWSPSGQLLASGDDDANIIIWNLKTDNVPLLEGDTGDTEIWLINKILRGHKEDVYDLCWSPNGLKLLSGSIDNTAIVWDITKGKTDNILTDHKGFVQGVAWDPKGQYIATLSSDRVCRVFDNTGKSIKSRSHKGLLPVPESHSLFNKEVKYFHDDTFKSYFRRLSFSCDGNLLFSPSGCIDMDNSKTLQATYVFTLDRLTLPTAILPSPKQITIATRCCPVLYELNNDGPDPVVNLPYRMVIAVATDRDVLLYDTQQLLPIAHFHRIHYTRITDLTWSPDGQILLVSSTDGFCTFITFEKNELGCEYTKEESEEEDMNVSVPNEQETSKTVKKNILQQWTLKTPKNSDINGKHKAISIGTLKTLDNTNINNEKKAMPIAVRREPKRAVLMKVGETDKQILLKHTGPLVTHDSITTEKNEQTTVSKEVADVTNNTIIEIHDHRNDTHNSPPVLNTSKDLLSDKMTTPKSISKFNTSSENSNSSHSKKRKKDSSKALIKNSPLFKFLKKSTKDENAATVVNKDIINKNDNNSSNSLQTPADVIIIDDSNDGITFKTIDNDISNTNNKSVTEKENDVQCDSKPNLPSSEKTFNNLSNLNQSPSSKVLPKSARRIQLVTLSSPKRKKQE